MDEKKISFGFTKNIKKPSLLAGPASSVSLRKDDSKQMIECLEGQSIKIIGKTEKEPAPLVIPLREQDKTTIPDRLVKVLGIKQEIHEKLNNGQQLSVSTDDTNGESKKEINMKLEPPEEREVNVVHEPHENETLEQRATREILEDIQQSNVNSEQSSNFVVPLLPEDLPLDGARESSMDDYESVPIEKYGLAMLRGMGWKDPDPKKVDPKVRGPDLGPVMRPKGLGLGADRAMKAKAINAHLIPPAQGETLAMKCGAQVKVLAGKYKDAYGTNGVPERIILLDWQLTRYVTPVLDLVYFIFCCTEGEFRRRHYDEMMSIYYNSLEALLEKLGHVPQSVFPRTAFMRQLRTFGRFGVLMAVFLVPMLCTRNEDLVDMDEAAEKFRDTKEMDLSMFSKNDNNRSAYTKRMREVIKDSVRYGYL